jgi:N-acetylmuramoyl-L-alanine amidase
MKYFSLAIFFLIAITNPGFTQHSTYSTINPTKKAAINKYRIVLDPGHGGRDSVTRGGELLEKNLVLDVSLEVKSFLEKQGYEVLMTRSKDEYIPLPQRAALKGDIFISFHANAVADSIGPSVRSMIKGIDIYTSIEMASKDLLLKSNLLAKSFATKLKELNGITVRGIKKKSLAVLDSNSSPAILIELGFLSNEEDLAFLRNKSNYLKIAEVVTKAIKDFRHEDAVTRN